MDDDCDVASADGSEDPLNGAACDGDDEDLCLEGTNSCTGGILVCSGETGSTVEVCDGLDNDCDEAIDEGFDQDLDLVADCFDNCPTISNPSQGDRDGDFTGDVCDTNPVFRVSELDPEADYTTIQAAVDDAEESGTRIEIWSGLYEESVVVDRDLVIRFVGIDDGSGPPEINGDTEPGLDLMSTLMGKPIWVMNLAFSGDQGIRTDVPTRLRNLDFSGVAMTGLQLDGGAHRARGLSMVGKGESGIVVGEDATLYMASAEIRGISATAVRVDGSTSVDTALLVQNGSGIVVGPSGSLVLAHATVAENAGAGLIVSEGGTVSLAHTILWGNSPDLVDVDCADVQWSVVGDPDCSGEGDNLYADPLFVGGGDFRLAAASPALDHGPDPADYTGVPCFDFGMGPRLRDYDGDNLAQIDPGAYEHANPALASEVELGWSSPTVLAWVGGPPMVNYSAYRGDLSSLSYANFGVCMVADDPATALEDPTLPAPGEGLFYLVTVVELAGPEGSLGLGTCAERSNFQPCP
jgi:hypothetical protein